MEIRKEYRETRKLRGFSLRDVSVSARMSVNSISKFENGGDIRLDNFESILDAIGYELVMIKKR